MTAILIASCLGWVTGWLFGTWDANARDAAADDRP